MAYDKVYPQNGQSILAFDTNQEDRVASEFATINAKVIGSGVSSNGYWEEYDNGIVKIWGNIVATHGAEGQIIVKLPYPKLIQSFISVEANLSGYNGSNDYYVRSAYQRAVPGNEINVYVKIGTPNQGISFFVIGKYI